VCAPVWLSRLHADAIVRSRPAGFSHVFGTYPSTNGLAVGLFYVFQVYVFQVRAVFPGGEGDAFAGVANGAHAVATDVDVFGIG
jgi:hypothetical protein